MADQMNAYEANRLARMRLIPGPNTQTVRRLQQIFSQTVTNYAPGQQLQLVVPPAPVGIITKFIVKVTASIGRGAAETQNRVQNGAAAILGNVQYNDTSNQTRINCAGWYLNHLSMIRRQFKPTGAVTMDNNNVDGIGANWGAVVSAAPAAIAVDPPAANAPNLVQFYEVPLAYSDTDLRGAVLAALINATQSLTLTVNPNFFVTSTDTVNVAEAGYQSTTAQLGKIASMTVTVYQEYIDQFQGLDLPAIDLGTQYLLQTTGGYQPVANTDLIIPYANFRVFMSTTLRYNNNGVFNTGSDVNYLAIRTANQSDLYKADPATWAYLNRRKNSDDFPAGYYFIDHREKPLFTNQYGNLSLVFQASQVGGLNSSVTVGYEQMALMNQIAASSAIGSGG